jgi:hypothetical protein
MGYHTECASKAKYQLQGSIAADTLKIYLLLQHYLFVGLRPLYHQPTNQPHLQLANQPTGSLIT